MSLVVVPEFEVGEFYMHANALDVCIQVAQIKRLDDEGAHLTVFFWNLGCVGRPWLIEKNSTDIFIPAEVMPEWVYLEPWQMAEPRHTSGYGGFGG